MNRAFHIAGIVWFTAVLVIGGFGLSSAWCAVAGAVVLAVLIVAGKLPLWVYAAAAAFCACSVSIYIYSTAVTQPLEQYAGQYLELTGLVTELEPRGSYAVLTIRTLEPEALAGENVQLSINAALDVTLGDVVKYNASLEIPNQSRTYLYGNGIRFLAKLPSGMITVTGSQVSDLEVRLAQYRAAFCKNITRNLTGPEGTLLASMLVGRSRMVAADLREIYARGGISHLLAVSGLHLAVLAELVDCVLRALRCSRRQRSLGASLAVFCFMALAGFSFSVVRAGIMVLLCEAARLFGRDSDSLNSLGLAAVLILLCNPYAAFSVGFQLSYLATMGIAAFATPLADWLSFRLARQRIWELAESRLWQATILQSLSTTLCACFLTLPVICREFGTFSLVSPLVNVSVAPLVPATLFCGMLAGLTGFFPELALLSKIFAAPAGICLQSITETARWWAQWRFSALSVQCGGVSLWLYTAAFGLALLLAFQAPMRVLKYAASLSGLVLLVVLNLHAIFWQDTIAVASAESGKTVALACKNGGAVIGIPDSAAEAKELIAFFESHGVEKLSLLVAEHGDSLDTYQAELLTARFSPEYTFGLDEIDGFRAVLFGDTEISAAGPDAQSVQITAAGLRIVKEFTQAVQRADLLINARGELICAPWLTVRTDDRYFGCRVISLKRSGHEIPVGK